MCLQRPLLQWLLQPPPFRPAGAPQHFTPCPPVLYGKQVLSGAISESQTLSLTVDTS